MGSSIVEGSYRVTKIDAYVEKYCRDNKIPHDKLDRGNMERFRTAINTCIANPTSVSTIRPDVFHSNRKVYMNTMEIHQAYKEKEHIDMNKAIATAVYLACRFKELC